MLFLTWGTGDSPSAGRRHRLHKGCSGLSCVCHVCFKLPSKGRWFWSLHCFLQHSQPWPPRPNSLCRGELTGKGRMRTLGWSLLTQQQPPHPALCPSGGRVQGDAAPLWSGEEAPPVSACVKVSCSVCDPMDCSPPGSSVPGILQTRILQWVAIPFSRGSS